MEYPVEFGATALDNFAESKHFDKVYDKVTGKSGQKKKDNKDKKPRSDDGGLRSQRDSYVDGGNDYNDARSENTRPSRRHRNELPEPEGDYNDYAYDRGTARGYQDPLIEEQSETSDRVLRAYENERDDPKRKPDASIVRSVRGSAMSYANGGYGRSERPLSQQPPRSRYYDDEESDYDERTGRKYKSSGRGYDADRDREFDREIVETERYRGPARDYDPRRHPSNDPYNAAYAAGPAAAGAVAPYRRSQGDLSRRSKSRGRRERSYSRSRSRTRSRSNSGIRGKLDEAFDTSLQGAGVAIAGALVGGLAGRELGGGRKNQKRDMLIGALVGGLGANAAENQWREYQAKQKGEERYEGRYGGQGRSRSNVRG